MSKSVSAPLEPLRAISHAIDANIDPMGMVMPLMHAQLAWMVHPQEFITASSRLSTQVAALIQHTWLRALGLPSEDVVKPHPDDIRFADPIWTEVATWDIIKQWYLALTHEIQDMLYETPGLDSRERRRAAFWWRKWLNAVAPTNMLWSNPVALQKALETRGESLRMGLMNFIADMNAGTVRMADAKDFVVGKNLATTPGKVVFRNRLLEVIRYTPTRTAVHPIPIVIVTPWINKFYVLDLTPKKSMVKFLLDQGFDVFITSWKNPDAAMRDVRFDDYITDGIDRIVNVARTLSGAAQAHTAGYCIGGAALSMYLAWATRQYPEAGMPVASATLFTTLVDYHKPGDIEVFLDQGSIQWLTRSMERKGFLDGKEMGSAFRLLRSNSLIWHYVVHGWLYGEAPPPFDVLYWNMDTTRMPAAMHAWYLRELYMNNNLVKKDALTLAGQPIDLSRIKAPLYAVSAVDDHIAPWRQTFRVNNFFAGEKRFVLSSSGHILGIVNPLVNPPKRDYRVGNAELHDSSETWRERAEEHQGSWWEDWMAWLKPRSGKPTAAPALTNSEYPALADAPGTYVLER